MATTKKTYSPSLDHMGLNHKVIRRIKYRSGLPGQTYIDPDPKKTDPDWEKMSLTFDHLKDQPGGESGYLKLCLSGFIRPLGM